VYLAFVLGGMILSSIMLPGIAGPVSAQVTRPEIARLMTDAARYYSGIDRPVNQEKALTLYRRAAEAGDSEARYILGGMYYRGIGTGRDEREGVKWLLLAAEAGRATPLSHYVLGLMYLRGEAVPQNYAEARRWYALSAAAGNRQARNDLAYMYYNGLGGERDLARALALYQAAAEQGDAQAQYNLGLMYAGGNGTELDRVRGYAWFSLAASQGNSFAAGTRNALLVEMSWDELERAQALSVELYHRIMTPPAVAPPPSSGTVPGGDAQDAADAVMQPRPLELAP